MSHPAQPTHAPDAANCAAEQPSAEQPKIRNARDLRTTLLELIARDPERFVQDPRAVASLAAELVERWPYPRRYAVAVGQRFLSHGGRLVREQTLLTADEAIDALRAGGFETCMWISEEMLPGPNVQLRMRAACAMVLAEWSPEPEPEPKPAPEPT